MTEPKVVRYRPCPEDDGVMIESPTGGYVSWRQYSALAARVQELEDDVREGVEAQVRYVAEITRLREALREYGHHKPHCKLDPCDCGILEALKEKS